MMIGTENKRMLVGDFFFVRLFNTFLNGRRLLLLRRLLLQWTPVTA
jgi:hypothetical protein